MDTERRNAETLARHRKILVKMLFKVTAYYAVLAGAVAIAVATIPGFAAQLPLGGVGEIADFGSSSIYDLEEALRGRAEAMEVGAGKVLCGLARRINRDIATSNVGSPSDIEKVLEEI